MFLDEKLLQLELERVREEDRERLLEETKELILKQEREQKSVDQAVAELKSGVAVIDGKEFKSEITGLLKGNAVTFVFPEDVEQIIEENNISTVFYKTLEIGANLTYLKVPLAIKNENMFQTKLAEQYAGEKITYYPLETGNLRSGNKTIRYAAGVTTSAAGGIFIINFYYTGHRGTVTGNYTCRLIKRYTFQNLFIAMLQLMCEEEK